MMSAMVGPYRHVSYWFDSLPSPVAPRPRLGGDLDVDVAVVGAGYTGLWTAYYLAKADPTLRLAVIEREIAGFGASGRNGGWCSALFATSDAKLEREFGTAAALSMRRAMQATVDEVGGVAEAEGIDCHWSKGGTVVLARSESQLARLRGEVASARRLGLGEDDIAMLSATEAATRVGATGVLGGTFTPHCAAIHPARLVRGLAEAVERLGVKIFEQTPVTALHRWGLTTTEGVVRAGVVVRATEGYTAKLQGERRAVVPLYSLMLATEPLGAEFWQEAGLDGRATFADDRHLVIYGQRTADDRIAFGGRGAPYHFASQVQPGFDRVASVHAAIGRTLVELFPSLSQAAITHRWGGPLGVPRDWFSSVGFDRSTGRAWAGGYVGDGVSTTNLAGRTLANLILEQDSELTALPWVGHRSPRWEPEPLRWLGVNAGLALTAAADRSEERSGRQSKLASALGRFLGG
jgi:glycine/D-amino acid oxidase-like deaminating enzyme